VSRYQKGRTNLDFTEARDSEWQWHQLGDMQVCTSLQTDNHASTPPLKFFIGQMPFLPPNQQRQSTEGNRLIQQNSPTNSTEGSKSISQPVKTFTTHTAMNQSWNLSCWVAGDAQLKDWSENVSFKGRF